MGWYKYITQRVTMMNIRTNGTAVTGTYHGVPFTGMITHNDIVGNVRGARYYALHIDLDEPIWVIGTQRDSVRMEIIPARDWKSGADGDCTVALTSWVAEAVRTRQGYSVLLGGVCTLVDLPEAWANKAVRLLNAIVGTDDQRTEMKRITAAIIDTQAVA